MDPERVELSLLLCESSVLPLDDGPMVELEGVAPSSPACRAGILLLNYSPMAPLTGFEPVIS